MVLIQLGEVVFGGVGSGLYGMLIFAILAVFIAACDSGVRRIVAWRMKTARIAADQHAVQARADTAEDDLAELDQHHRHCTAERHDDRACRQAPHNCGRRDGRETGSWR